MLLVIFIISVILLVVSAVRLEDSYYEGLCCSLCVISAISAIVSFFGLIVLGIEVTNGKVIDEKIAMYTEENAKIEASIDELVSRYMDFEANTFSDLKADSAITLVSLYPELKSDELVKAQIETYQGNNATIKRLREEKISLSVKKWWLYFGK